MNRKKKLLRNDRWGWIDLKLNAFAEQGGEGVVVDAQGDVYPATGEVFVYGASGILIDAIQSENGSSIGLHLGLSVGAFLSGNFVCTTFPTITFIATIPSL